MNLVIVLCNAVGAMDRLPVVLCDRRHEPPPMLIQAVEMPTKEERHPDVTGYYSRSIGRRRYEASNRLRQRSQRGARS